MKRVIICEDDPLLAIDLAHQVEDAGSVVCGSFASSFEAWRAASVINPDVAIIDLRLADGDSGAALATHLAAQGCKVIVVSGSTVPHSELSQIPHCFVSKPVPMGVIAELTGTPSGPR